MYPSLHVRLNIAGISISVTGVQTQERMREKRVSEEKERRERGGKTGKDRPLIASVTHPHPYSPSLFRV